MEQLKQLMQAVLAGDQQATQQFQQLIQDPQQGPQVVQAIQQMAQQGDTEAQQFVQMLSQGQPMSAKLGGKLRTVATLNNICPEGYELKVFKAGGTICKRCMKKAENGAKVEKKKMSAAEEYKASKSKLTDKELSSDADYSDLPHKGVTHTKASVNATKAKQNKEQAAINKNKASKKELGGLITKEVADAFVLKCGGSTKSFKEKKALVGKKGTNLKKKKSLE